MKNPFKKSEVAAQATPAPKHSTEALEHHRLIYTNALALDLCIEQAERAAVLRAQSAYNDGCAFFHFANHVGLVVKMAQNFGSKIAGAKALRDTVRASALFIEAAEIIEPLLKAEAGQAARELAASQLLAQTKQAHRETLEAAQARALKTAETDPDVIAAKRKLEALGN